MNPKSNPHDGLFKKTLRNREIAASFFKHNLPRDVLTKIDLKTLKIEKDSFVNNELAEYFSDILYSVQTGNRQGFVYLLFEHKSYPDRKAAFQMLGYMHRIWSLHIEQKGMPLPAILPILIYHGQEKLNLQGEFAELMSFDPVFQRYIPNFAYHLVDLSVYPDDEIKGVVLLRVVMLLFKYVHRPDYHERLFDILKELKDKKTGMQYLETLLRYIMSTVPDMTRKQLRQIVKQSLSQDLEGTIMTLEEKLKQEGQQEGKLEGRLEEKLKQEGRQEGKQEGLQLGIQKAIQLGLKLKFGTAGIALMGAIQKVSDISRLNEIMKAIESTSQLSDIRKMILE